MLFAVRMDVSLPLDLDPGFRDELLATEKAHSQKLQREGKWVHLWRVVGEYSNLSVFDVSDNGELHDLLWNLPLFKYMSVSVTPLAQHPSALVG
ncbi:muconolactone Delta-isomerase [Amycolatopsis sp. DSM 110486]|uniref:muconolactone Delta-isomerase n=1 Tax=Amycolatopsis sp. DSM 110486 TaxID=2865832 RepID=UPI001C694699|nr:muconolactone Delta-isomerase [Amycolatopsis sp. DSM 110486]QYN23234.1 muconolactone Delta-isomerase [Amycolatopsis sp. DSM 110486]